MGTIYDLSFSMRDILLFFILIYPNSGLYESILYITNLLKITRMVIDFVNYKMVGIVSWFWCLLSHSALRNAL